MEANGIRSCGTAVPEYVSPTDHALQLVGRSFVYEILVPCTRARLQTAKKLISKVLE